MMPTDQISSTMNDSFEIPNSDDELNSIEATAAFLANLRNTSNQKSDEKISRNPNPNISPINTQSSSQQSVPGKSTTPQHYKAQSSSLPNDESGAFARAFEATVNSGSKKKLAQLFQDNCLPNCEVSLIYPHAMNPLETKYVEMRGMNAVVNFMSKEFQAVPDAILTIKESKLWHTHSKHPDSRVAHSHSGNNSNNVSPKSSVGNSTGNSSSGNSSNSNSTGNSKKSGGNAIILCSYVFSGSRIGYVNVESPQQQNSSILYNSNNSSSSNNSNNSHNERITCNTGYRSSNQLLLGANKTITYVYTNLDRYTFVPTLSFYHDLNYFRVVQQSPTATAGDADGSTGQNGTNQLFSVAHYNREHNNTYSNINNSNSNNSNSNSDIMMIEDAESDDGVIVTSADNNNINGISGNGGNSNINTNSNNNSSDNSHDSISSMEAIFSGSNKRQRIVTAADPASQDSFNFAALRAAVMHNIRTQNSPIATTDNSKGTSTYVAGGKKSPKTITNSHSNNNSDNNINISSSISNNGSGSDNNNNMNTANSPSPTVFGQFEPYDKQQHRAALSSLTAKELLVETQRELDQTAVQTALSATNQPDFADVNGAGSSGASTVSSVAALLPHTAAGNVNIVGTLKFYVNSDMKIYKLECINSFVW